MPTFARRLCKGGTELWQYTTVEKLVRMEKHWLVILLVRVQKAKLKKYIVDNQYILKFSNQKGNDKDENDTPNLHHLYNI